jgi:hypothetical protein
LSNNIENNPPSTLPPSLPPVHFTLGDIYTDTFVFFHRGYNFDVAFHIIRSATYLGLDTLHYEI